MKRQVYTFAIIIMSAFFVACNEDAGFSSSPSLRLDFSTDTVSFDTLFTDRVSPSALFVVRNRNGNALRISDVCLASGGASGFNVIVDGQYGAHMRDIGIRANDSIFVMASVKLDRNGCEAPLEVKDSLLFTLESGVVQHVLLMAHGRDVEFIYSGNVAADTLMTAGHYVVYDSLCVAAGATLTVEPGAVFYFHDKAFMKVEGTLDARGSQSSPVVFRCDRTDNLFDYLPYDRIPGRWGGILFASSSNGNVLEHCDVHGAEYGVRVERGDTAAMRLAVESSKLHNFKGHAMELQQARVSVANSLIANAEGNCVKIVGGDVSFVHCTIANFYVWTQRDVALALHNSLEGEPAPLYGATFRNCVVTGSKEDEIMGYFTAYGDSVPNSVNYRFENSLINTVDTQDSCFVNVVYDSREGTPFAKEHFAKIDNEVFDYDFHLMEGSTARGIASDSVSVAFPYDLDGMPREAGKCDAGCYQFVATEGEESAD
jgi:hypothetical protein